jgi:hypothetical protein
MPTNSTAATLEQWVRDQPGSYMHLDLHIADDEDTGMHWRPSASIDPGTKLITVPHNVALSYLNALVDDKYPVFRQYRNAFKVEAIGFFYLALQYIHRATSFWKPYLDSLPTPDDGHTTPLWFDDPADEAWLADTDALYTMNRRRAVYEQQYHSGIATLRKAGVDTESLTW